MEEVSGLISEFNEISHKLNFNNEYVLYSSHPGTLFMKVRNKTSIDLQTYITENLKNIAQAKQSHPGSAAKKQPVTESPNREQTTSATKQPLYPVTCPTF
jgi:hypothetical protein